MARSLSGAKQLISLSVLINKRGFANSAKGVFPSKAAMGGGNGKVVAMATEEVSSMWVPDPVTGYYRPENKAIQVDAADLRKRFLKRKLTLLPPN